MTNHKLTFLGIGFAFILGAGCAPEGMVADVVPGTAPGAPVAALSPSPSTMPRQDEAIAVVWRQVFGQKGPPPAITWKTGAELDCGGGTAFMDSAGECVWGVTYDDNHSEIAWGGRFLGSGPDGNTPFAHELGHAASLADTDGDLDAAHAGPYFRGAYGGHVNMADDALRIAGL